MALAQLPPWLNVKPTDFAQAAYQGQSLANERARVGVEAAGVANQAAKIQSDSQLAMLQLSLQKQNQDRDFMQKATEFAVNSELAKQGMDLTFKDASMKLLSQLSYQKAYDRIASENPNLRPDEVMMRASAETGYVNPGMAAMFKTSQGGAYGSFGAGSSGGSPSAALPPGIDNKTLGKAVLDYMGSTPGVTLQEAKKAVYDAYGVSTPASDSGTTSSGNTFSLAGQTKPTASAPVPSAAPAPAAPAPSPFNAPFTGTSLDAAVEQEKSRYAESEKAQNEAKNKQAAKILKQRAFDLNKKIQSYLDLTDASPLPANLRAKEVKLMENELLSIEHQLSRMGE